MARNFTYVDVTPWKVVNHQGKTLHGEDGKPLNNFKGYRDAKPIAARLGGVPVRS